MKKKGLLGGLFLIIILVILFFLLSKLSKAETITNIVNVTITINSTDIIVNVSNNLFNLNNTASVINIQQNFSFFYFSNITISNQTIMSNVTCNNSSISLSCSCPSVNCPSLPSLINSSCSEVGFSNATKEEFYNHYVTSLSSKIEESSNKVAADVLFKLQPTTAQLDECRGNAANASLRQFEAEKQRDTALSAYDSKLVDFENTRKELSTLQIVFIGFIIMIVIGFISYVGLVERRGNLWG